LTHPECKAILKDALLDSFTYTVARDLIKDLEELYRNPTIQKLIRGTDEVITARNILILCQDYEMEQLVEKLKQEGVSGINLWAKDMRRALGDEEGFGDFYLEGHYALKLARHKLEVEFRPFGKKGPDLRVSQSGNWSILIEVTRFRPDKSIEKALYEAGQRGKLVEYPITTSQIYDRILREYPQLIKNAFNIIILHSDHVAKEEIDFKTAISYISEEILRDNTRHTKVSAIILCCRWRDPDWTRCYVFHNQHATRPIPSPILEKVAMALDPRFKIYIPPGALPESASEALKG
jgi:hypothetical protein